MHKVIFHIGVMLSFTLCQDLYAHVMLEQHATLRFTAKGAYFLGSYPISAFIGIDDNKDGLIDHHELRTHKSQIIKQIHKNIKLYDNSLLMELEGLVINLSHVHDQKSKGKYLIIMGRFKLVKNQDIRFVSKLFGRARTEQILKLRVTRQAKPMEFTLLPSNYELRLPQIKVSSD